MHGRRGSVKLAVLFALRAPDHTCAAREALCSQGGGTGLQSTDSPNLAPVQCIALEPLRLQLCGAGFTASTHSPCSFYNIQERQWEPPGPATQRDALRVQQEEPHLRPPDANRPGLPPRRKMSTYRV